MRLDVPRLPLAANSPTWLGSIDCKAYLTVNQASLFVLQAIKARVKA